MTIPKFIGDENKDEINHEMFEDGKENGMNNSMEKM